MYKGLLLLLVLSCICLIVQLLSVITVPITFFNYNLYLAKYNEFVFGVFGVCDLVAEVCSVPKIGYPSVNSSFYVVSDYGDYSRHGGVKLPSRATYTISKLLVVHVIAFCVSCLLFLVILLFMGVLWVDETSNGNSFMEKLKNKLKSSEKSSNNIESTTSTKNSPTSSNSISIKVNNKKKRDISPFLNVMLLLSLISFLSTLLAFLVDILLFVSQLSYLGWLQLLPIILLVVTASMLCFIKRSVSSRKYLEDDHIYENDDMRMRNNVDVDRWNDSASDDGFYVYTNGFYSTYNNNNDINRNHVRLSHNNNSTYSGWIRHAPQNETGDEISLNSISHSDGETNSQEPRLSNNDHTN